MRKISKIVLIIVGVILILIYAMPLVAGILNIGNIFGIIVGTFLIIFATLLDKLNKAVISIICVLAIIGTSVFSVTLYNIIDNREDIVEEQNATLIVLGCKVDGNKPSLQLYKRAMTGVDYLNEHPNEKAILCGGQGSDENISEAECIKRIMLDKGIDENRLYIEDKSTSTKENISFAKDILEENGFNYNVVIVTSDYHCYRAKLIAKKAGLYPHSIPAYADKFSLPTFYTREVFGVWAQYLK